MTLRTASSCIRRAVTPLARRPRRRGRSRRPETSQNAARECELAQATPPTQPAVDMDKNVRKNPSTCPYPLLRSKNPTGGNGQRDPTPVPTAPDVQIRTQRSKPQASGSGAGANGLNAECERRGQYTCDVYCTIITTCVTRLSPSLHRATT